MEELASLLQRNVTVETADGKRYTGILSGADTNNLNICLTGAKDGAGQLIPKLILTGSSIRQIFTLEKSFDLLGLADRLERVFPRMVKTVEPAGVIVVMDKIRVTQKGVIEGSGPAAERVHRVYEEFMKDQAKST